MSDGLVVDPSEVSIAEEVGSSKRTAADQKFKGGNAVVPGCVMR